MKHVVGFSGGIDSQAETRLLRNRYGDENVIALNSQAGRWEHDITAKFVADYSASIFPILEVVPIVADIWETDEWAETKGLDGNQELTMELLISIKKRPPSRKAKFCTEILKLRPQRRWMRKEFGPGGMFEGEEFVRHAGVRRDESPKRRNTPFIAWDEFFDCELHCDIADWTKPMCFEYVTQYGEPFNSLYLQGFDRVGCAPCVDADKADILNWELRFPGFLESKVGPIEERTGKTFFMPMFRHEKNNIKTVIEWAKTDRGGTQFKILEPRQSCESRYGLCE